MAERGASRRLLAPDPAYWLIANSANGRVEVFTIECSSEGEVLPVFGHEEEAEMFLRLGEVEDGWRVRESRAGEVVSVLYGPCADVKEVALDPLPEMVAERIVGLVSLPRERFIEGITARSLFGLCEPGWGSSPHEGEWNQRNETDRIAVQYTARRLYDLDTS
jgi:hypothetical protein